MTVPPRGHDDALHPTESPPVQRAVAASGPSPGPTGTVASAPVPAAPADFSVAPVVPVVAPARPYLSGIVTSGLAAVSGATIASWTGVQGTLIGAIIGATIGSAVSEIVRAPLDALERRI